MAQVIIYPRGQLTGIDRARLEKAGIVVAEADNPERVIQTIPVAGLVSGDAILLSALEALSACVYDAPSKHFVQQLALRAQAAEGAKP